MRVGAHVRHRYVDDKVIACRGRLRVWAVVTVLGVAVVVGGACTLAPKNPADFKRAVQEGGWRRYLEERTISRGFDTVFSGMSRSAERCLNTVHRSSTPGKYGPQSEVVYYRAAISSPRPGAGEIVVQMDSPNLVNGPEGGVYILVADVEASSAGASKVTVYAAGKGGDIVAPVLAWAEGNEGACPEL